MSDVKISRSCYVPKDNIDYYAGYDLYAVKRDIRERKKDGLVIDYTEGKKTSSVVYLKSGKAFLVTTSIETLKNRMETADNQC